MGVMIVDPAGLQRTLHAVVPDAEGSNTLAAEAGDVFEVMDLLPFLKDGSGLQGAPKGVQDEVHALLLCLSYQVS